MVRQLLIGALIALLGAPALTLGGPAHANDDARAAQLAGKGAKAYRDKRYEEALAHFRAANQIVPHPNLDVNIGRCYLKLGQPEQAIINCKIALNAPGVPSATRAAAQKCVESATAELARPVLELSSSPPGASVRLDGRVVGKTPWRGDVAPGRRQVDLELDGYAPVSRTIITQRGESYPLTLVLTPEQVGAIMSVGSAPPGATVFVDGEAVGRTPLNDFQIEPGPHVVELRLNGYSAQTATVTIDDGARLDRVFTLVPLGGAPSGPRAQWPGWAMIGVGVAAVGVGAWAGVNALDDQQAADDIARTSNLESDKARYDDLVDSMESNRTLADVFFVTGGLAVAGGMTWLLWPESRPPTPDQTARFQPDP
jgi:hypothetical protein